MPFERNMNYLERSKWAEFSALYKKASFEIQISILQKEQYAIANKFASENSLTLKKASESKAVFEAFYRLQKWVAWVDDQTLGLTLEKKADGQVDFNICARPGTSADELANYKNPGFAGLPLIIAGVVVVASVIAYVVLIRSELSNLRSEYNGLLNDADSKFCAVPGSPICQSWIKRKSDSGYNQKTSTIEGLKNKVEQVVETVSKGIGKGLIVAIPLLILYFAMTARKK